MLAASLAGSALAFYALIGFEDSVNVAEETRDPSRAYPRALFGGLAIAGALYLLVTIGASMVVPTGDLVGSSGALLEVVDQGPLGVPEKLFAAIGLLALSNGALINMIMASRLLYGMAQEGVMPRPFARVLPGRRTPWTAILFTSSIAAVLVATGDLASLADTRVALLVVVFGVVNVSARPAPRARRARALRGVVGRAGGRRGDLGRAADADRGRDLGARGDSRGGWCGAVDRQLAGSAQQALNGG